jgi:hypothetical protein
MTPQDFLAAYRFPAVEPRYAHTNDPRRTWRRFVTDEDGERHSAAIPSPVAMAEAFARPLLEQRFGAVHRRPGGTLIAEDGSPLPEATLRGLVLAALLALPPREGLGPYDAYTGVLRFVADDPSGDALSRYALHVARACSRRDVFPAPPVPASPKRVPRVSKTPAQWKADQRARDRSAETQSARAWLELYLVEAEPGDITAADLHSLASEGIQDYIDDEAEHEDGTPWRVPGPRTFYAIADSVLGPRRRASQGAQTYRIPDPEETDVSATSTPAGDAIAEAVLDRVARLVLEETRPSFLALSERRDATLATTADNVTDLGAHRRRRLA